MIQVDCSKDELMFLSLSDHISPHFDLLPGVARILLHPLVDLGTVCHSYIAPMFLLWLVSVRYSKDSATPKMSKVRIE